MKLQHTFALGVIVHGLSGAAALPAKAQAADCLTVPAVMEISGIKPTDCFSTADWQKAVSTYDASSRVEFKSDWSKRIINALRAYEAGQ